MISSIKIGIIGFISIIGYIILALNNCFNILEMGYFGVMLIPTLLITVTCSLIALQYNYKLIIHMIFGGVLASIALGIISFVIEEKITISQNVKEYIVINSRLEYLNDISILLYSLTISFMIMFSVLYIVEQNKEKNKK